MHKLGCQVAMQNNNRTLHQYLNPTNPPIKTQFAGIKDTQESATQRQASINPRSTHHHISRLIQYFRVIPRLYARVTRAVPLGVDVHKPLTRFIQRTSNLQAAYAHTTAQLARKPFAGAWECIYTSKGKRKAPMNFNGLSRLCKCE